MPGHWIAVKLFDASHVPGRAGCSCTPCTIDRNLDDAWASRRRRGRPRGKCHTTAFLIPRRAWHVLAYTEGRDGQPLAAGVLRANGLVSVCSPQHQEIT